MQRVSQEQGLGSNIKKFKHVTLVDCVVIIRNNMRLLIQTCFFYMYNKQNNCNIKGKKVVIRLESTKLAVSECQSVSQVRKQTQPIDNNVSVLLQIKVISK